jgi:hypothetical protein
LFGRSGVEDLVEIGRQAHAIAELRQSSTRALTAAEHAIVSQAAERIIPRTSTPGATDARVTDFIDVMLADWYDTQDRERFKTGLRELDTRARSLGAQVFVKSSERQQTEVLDALDRELHDRRQSGAQGVDDHWFAMLKFLTIWGYYSSRPGIVEELRLELMPGRYDGNARY